MIYFLAPLLFIFFSFSAFAAPRDGVWATDYYTNSDFTDVESYCKNQYPYTQCPTQNHYTQHIGSFSECLPSNVAASCKRTLVLCPAPTVPSITVNLTSLQGPTFICRSPKVVQGVCPELRCVCPTAQYNGECVSVCPPGTVKNPFTNICQSPCESSGWESTGVQVPYGTTFNPNPFKNCVNGCEYEHRITEVCHPGALPAYLCLENEIVSRTNGQMCSGSSAGPTPIPPVNCGAGYELHNGQCRPTFCPDGNPRQPDGTCLPLCPNGFERIGLNCMRTCGENEVRNPVTQICDNSCPAGHALLNNKCIPSKCPDSQQLQNGRCEDRPPNPNCGPGEKSGPQGNCLPDCPNASDALVNGICVPVTCPQGQSLQNGSCQSSEPIHCQAGMRPSSDNTKCVPLSCASGERISYALNKCVSDDSAACPAGQHKEGDACVADRAGDCPVGTTFISGCGCKPSAMDTTEFCQSTHNNKGPLWDIDGDGIPNDADNDIDGDGTPNESDKDQDGDGIPNDADTKPAGPNSKKPDDPYKGDNDDYDGDGIPNKSDPDKDGDGIPNDKDPTPDGSKNNKPGGGQCNPATENCDDKQGKDSPGAPASLPGDFYDGKLRNFAGVFSDFRSRLSNAAIAKAGSSFFTMSSVSGSCPNWTIPASDFYPSITIDFQCSQAIVEGLHIAGSLVLLVAAWVAVRIALIEG